MADKLDLKTSHSFAGLIWNTLADEDNRRLFVEVRDVQQKRVSFSALNLQNNEWLWKDVSLEEPWWITLAGVAGDILLLTLYTDAANPEKKSLLAYDVLKNEIAWWYNGFSLSAAGRRHVRGVDSKFPSREIVLDPFTGKQLQDVDFDLGVSQNFPVIRPFQYEERSGHFITVKNFLETRLGIQPLFSIEYLEWGSLIATSVYVKEEELANYLYVFDPEGELILTEKLGENLKGVGLDTFFIFSDHLFFVKNKRELVSYRIV